jgi:uncharacterized membrane protein YkoI
LIHATGGKSTKTINYNKKTMVADGIAIAVAVSVVGLLIQSPALAQQLTIPNNNDGSSNNNMNSLATIPGTTSQRVNITGSINIFKVLQDNVKVSFTDAANTAQKQVSGGTVVSGHLGIVQGYLVYTFTVVDTANNTAHMVIVDAGNGSVLHTSQGYSIGNFGGYGLGFGGQHWHKHGMW